MYDGIAGTYQTDNETSYNTPFEALIEANRKWEEAPDLHVSRLLIVLRKPDAAEVAVDNEAAYFQFTSSKACKAFARKKSQIVWSRADKQEWNGDANLM